MKRILTFLLTVTMLFTMLPTTTLAVTAEADILNSGLSSGYVTDPDIVSGDLYYTLDDYGVLTVYSLNGHISAEYDLAGTVEKYADRINQIRLSDTITYIESQSFDGCNLEVDLVLSESVEHIDGYAFARCGGLNLCMDGENANYKVKDGIIYSADMTQLVYAAPSLTGEFTVPSSVTTVCDGAFAGSNFAKIIIPDTVTNMMTSAYSTDEENRGIYGRIFTNSNVKVIEIGENVEMLGRCAIFRCPELETVIIKGKETAFEDDFVIDDEGSSIGIVYVMPASKAVEYMANYYNGNWDYVEIESEQKVTGTISFPEDAYLEGGSLIVDVWARGQITGEYKKVEFEIYSLEDVDFEFLFPVEETAVSTRVMLSNFSGAETNLYTATSSNLDFTLTENGMEDTYEFHYIDIAELATKEILMPCGKMISGKISGNNLQFVDNACLTLSFGNYWTRAFIDVETHEYSAVMPYGIIEGNYAPTLENSSENATSNILNGTYYYTESESVAINPAEDLTDLNFTVDTGYAVSGEVTIPENAVMDNYNITCELVFGEDVYYVTGVMTKPGLSEDNRSVPYMFGVDKSNTVSTILELRTYGYMADDMLSSTSYSNVLVGSDYSDNMKYYYSETETTLDQSLATTVTIDGDVENIDFDLQIGAVINAEITVPESVSEQYIWYDLYAVSLDGNIIAKISERTMPENDVNYAQLVVPDTYEEVYLMYKVNYDAYGDYPDIYTGKAYINADGSITGFRSDADSHSTYGGVTVQFELAEFDDVEIPETLEYEGNALESSHPFLSSNTESIYYAYDGDKDASNLKVTFSPLSWINEKATITICDAESNSTTYTAEEFNECISGETIDIIGPKFTVDITTSYVSTYNQDYGFAIVDIVPGEADTGDQETATYNFMVYDNTAAASSLIPVDNAEISITNNENFSYKTLTSIDGKANADLKSGTYFIEVKKNGYVTYSAEWNAVPENADRIVYLPLSAEGKTHVFFVILDKYTKDAVSYASISLVDSALTSSTLVTSFNGVTNAYFKKGTYTVSTSADGYVTDTRTVEISGEEQEIVIELEQIEVDIADNTTFTVMDGETEGTPVISGASLTITDEDGNVISTKTTDSAGKVTANLDNGTYHVTVIADGFKTESNSVKRTDSDTEFQIYLYRDEMVTVKTSVKEMTLDEMKKEGIDTDTIGNKQVYNCTAVLSFMPDVEINYIYSDDGAVLKGGTFTEGGKSVTPVAKDIYLLVKKQTSWLKETFEIQIICDNNSIVETVENLIADLTIPDGLSLAIMAEGEQKSVASLGNISPKGNASHKWYICGDKKGEYLLEGKLTGKRTGGIPKDMELTFGIDKPITVLSGDAMTLTIDAETSETVGEPYIMRYTLENVSEKTIYNLSYSVFGGKFFDDYTVKAAEYAKEYGPGGVKDLKGEGFLFETNEFKPGEKISGVFEITFGEELLLGEGQEWKLTDAFIVTGLGSTTVIPTKVNWLPVVEKHQWDEGKVTKAATCEEDGEILYSCLDVECGESYTDVIKATGHNMGDYVKVEPTCTEEGSETSSCQNNDCDHTVVIPLAKTDHAWKTDYTIDKKPTCTEKGSKSIHCENCSATTDVQEVKETGHNYGIWQTRTAATCEGTGEDYRVCANGCNIEETRTVASLGHDYAKEWTVDVAAKCEEKGSESRHCSRCSATTDKRDVAETGHNFTEWKTRIEAKCETEGEEYCICQNDCGKEETRPIGVLGHDWDNGTITKNPTETETGNKLYNCKRCPATKNETLPMLIKQDVGFTVPEMTYTYGDKEAIYNEAYNDSEDGSELTYSSSNENVATVDKDGKVTIIGAGEATITATAAATDKYLETTTSFKLTIKKAALTITANDAEIYYGEEGKNNGFTATGFVLDETEAVIKGTPVYEVNYKQFDKAGEYEITVNKLTADNYEITFKPGKLTVKKAEVYNIEFSNLSQRKGKISEVTASVTPKDDTAKIKIEYQFTDGAWVDTIPSDIGIGEYKVRAYLTESENLAINETPKYFESTLEIKAGAVVNLDENSDLSIDSNVSGDNVEFTIPDEAVEEIINNVPESGEIVIDATGSTGGVTNLTLPENIITALDESEDVDTFTVIADDAEISMSADVLKTVADEMSAGDKVNIHIEAVEKESLNEEQKAALDAIATDAHVLQLNLEVQKQDGTTELHELNGKVEVKATYTLPADMNGKKIVVCYVSDNGTVTYMRATYKDGFVHFKTDHFSHYAIAAIECTHTWDAGTVTTQATTSSEGLKRYECTICGETKDETIPKKTSYGGGGGTASCTVKFDTNGAGTIKSQTINKNGVVTEPTVPTKEGYTFAGWYTDKELTVAYDFATKVTKGFTLYAKWTEIEKGPEEDKSETSMAFTDVKSTDWFFDSVKYVADNKLMNGVSETEFAPNNTLTRAMLVTVLYRNAGELATNRSIPFADVDMGAYYANAVSWAKQNGIVSGVTENEFAPDTNITREQIATIIFRYAQYKGMDAVTLEENLHFTDADEISEYAVSAMNWAVGTGLMKGKSTTTINPKDNATRAEIAAILQRFIETNK